MTKTCYSYFIIFILFASCAKQNGTGKYPFKDSTLPIEKRVDDLLSRMTTEEKINQMDMYHC